MYSYLPTDDQGRANTVQSRSKPMELTSSLSPGLNLKILKMRLTRGRKQSMLKAFPILRISLATFLLLQRFSSVIFHSLIIWYTLASHRSPMITASPLSSIIHSEWEVEPIPSRLLSPFLIFRQGTSSSQSSLVQISLARPSLPTTPVIFLDGLDNSAQCNQVDWGARHNDRRCHYRFRQVRLGQVWQISWLDLTFHCVPWHCIRREIWFNSLCRQN